MNNFQVIHIITSFGRNMKKYFHIPSSLVIIKTNILTLILNSGLTIDIHYFRCYHWGTCKNKKRRCLQKSLLRINLYFASENLIEQGGLLNRVIRRVISNIIVYSVGMNKNVFHSFLPPFAIIAILQPQNRSLGQMGIFVSISWSGFLE